MIIKIEGLTKTFDRGKIKAVDNLNLEVKEGEVFGFLGPNGAGKTTTIRLLMDFIRPTKGAASIFGLNCQKDSVEIKKNIGYLSGDFQLYDRYSGEYLMKFLGSMDGGYDKEWVEKIVKTFDIDLTRKVMDLSRGNKQKVGLLQALALKPKLLIFDEPTSGLDPLMQNEFYKMMREMKKEGKTVFMSSHVMSEVEKVCDRVGILKEGALIEVKDVDDLLEAKSKIVDIVFKDGFNAEEFKINGVEIKHQGEKSMQLVIRGDINPLMKVLARHDLRDVSFNDPDLDDIFMKYYEDK